VGGGGKKEGRKTGKKGTNGKRGTGRLRGLEAQGKKTREREEA